MLRQFLKELLIIGGGTLFFLLLCATVGISTSTPPASPNAEAAHGEKYLAEELAHDGSPVCPLQDQQNRSLFQKLSIP